MSDKPENKKIKVVKAPEKKNEIIKKHNYLTKAKFRLSLHEARVYSWLVSEIHKDDEDITIYEMPVLEFARLTGSKDKNPYKHAKDVTAKLIKRFIQIEDLETGDDIQATLVSSAKYLKNQGTVRLEISSQLKPYLVSLTKGQYTLTYLPFVMSLKSVYSFRIYELLAQWRGAGGMTMKVQEIKETLGIEDVKGYNRFEAFERRVLQVAFNEVNQSTDIRFRYEKIKKGRSIDSIKFIITSGKKGSLPLPAPLQEESEDHDLLKQLISLGVTSTRAKRFVEKYSEERILKSIKYTDSQASGTVDNYAKYLSAAIEKGWGEEVINHKESEEKKKARERKKRAIIEHHEAKKIEEGKAYSRYITAEIDKLASAWTKDELTKKTKILESLAEGSLMPTKITGKGLARWTTLPNRPFVLEYFSTYENWTPPNQDEYLLIHPVK